MKVLFLFFTDPPRPFSSSVAALAAVTRASGHEPVALEVPLRAPIRDVADRICQIAPDVLGVSAMSRDWPGAHSLLDQVAARQRPFVVVGGYHASMAPRDVSACSAVDAICIGEGDRALPALLDRLTRGEALDPAPPGLWVRTASGWTAPLPSPDPEPDIAKLPWWDYDVFGDTRAHLLAGLNTFGPQVDRYLPVRASRGCPFTCSYCSAPRWTRMHGLTRDDRVNLRPVELLCDELASLRDRYDPEGFEFWDEHFPLQIEWLREFAAVCPARVGLPFKVEMHPNAASRERLELLVRAGCVLFHCGVEAGDETLRKTVLQRRTRDSELQRVFDDARSLGLATSASLMTMLPGETRAQAHSTVELLRALRPDSFMWSTYHPLPGSVLGESTVPAWPGPARERMNDYDIVAPIRPALMTAKERDETFLELSDLQAELVRAAGDPDRARPVEIPVPPRPASGALAALLGMEPPGSALSARIRLNRAAREGSDVVIEVESTSLPPQQVVIAPRSAAGHFVATQSLQLSYRGRDAQPALLDAIKALAKRLGPAGMDSLLRAMES